VYRCAGRGNLGFSIGSDRLTQAGQRAATLRQYEECVRILEAELRLPPSQETASLHEQIRAGAAGRAEPPVAQPRHNLPAQPTPFIGREAVLAEIREHLESPNCRLLTLVGPGGSGKTRLALEAAAAQAVTGASLRELMWLVDKSLLHRMPTGRYEVHVRQSLALYRSLGDRWSTAYVLEELGWLAWDLPAHGEASRLFEESLAIRQSLEDRRGVARSLYATGGRQLGLGPVGTTS
jgi:hypothetical protein